jgi:hypothetical protein
MILLIAGGALYRFLWNAGFEKVYGLVVRMTME